MQIRIIHKKELAYLYKNAPRKKQDRDEPTNVGCAHRKKMWHKQVRTINRFPCNLELEKEKEGRKEDINGGRNKGWKWTFPGTEITERMN